MINKQRQKLGMFGSKAKVSFQKGLREFKMDKLIEKSQDQELTEREKKRLTSSMALRSKNFNKKGADIFKGMPKSNKSYDKPFAALQGSGAVGDGPANNLNQELNTSTTLSVSQFLDSTPTGVFSQKDVKQGVNEFVKQLKGTPSVQNVQLQKQGNVDFGQINVGRDYQKATFDFNPKNLTFSTKGWNVEIPEEFIKKSDTLYVAPSKEYRQSYYYKKYDGGKKRKSKNYSSYTPVEIYLNATDPNKISKILKRDVYEDYDYRKETDDYRKSESTDKVYLDEQQLFYDTGILKQKKDWDDYTKSYDRTVRGKDYDKREERRDIFLRNQWDYNPKGYLTMYQGWDDYNEREEYERSGNYDRDEEERGAIYLRDKQEFNDEGKLLRRRRWDDYVYDEDYDRFYGGYEKEEKRKIQLERDEVYDVGKKVADFKYREYVTDVDQSKSDRVLRLRDTGFGGVDNLSSVSAFGNTKNTEQYFDEDGKIKESERDKLFVSPSVRQSIKRDTALQEATYYDPFTGEVIESFKFW